MDAKEYLSGIALAERRISKMEARLAGYEAMSHSVPGPSYEAHGKGQRRTVAPFIRWIDPKLELERKIAEARAELEALAKEAYAAIESMDAGEELKSVLAMRYVNLMDWADISEALCVSKPTLYRWHREALRLFKVPESADPENLIARDSP